MRVTRSVVVPASVTLTTPRPMTTRRPFERWARLAARPAMERRPSSVQASEQPTWATRPLRRTSSEVCAGTSTADAQGDSWIYVPAGTCTKLVGGSMQPKSS